jgi:hypothetical protein
MEFFQTDASHHIYGKERSDLRGIVFAFSNMDDDLTRFFPAELLVLNKSV